MPEFLPTPQLPTGMAEAIAKLITERGQAWGNMAQGLGQTAQRIGQNIYQKRQQKYENLTPEQMDYILKGQTPIPKGPNLPGTNGPLAIGQNAPQQPNQLFPKGIPPQAQSLMERVAAAKESTSRMFGVQEMKGQERLSSTHTMLTKESWDRMTSDQQKKFTAVGLGPGQLIPNAVMSTIAKPTSSSQTQALSEEELNALRDASLKHPDRFPPDLLKSRGLQPKFIAQQLLKNPEYNPAAANVGYAGEKMSATSAARLQASGPPQVLARYANSTKEVLKVAQEASDKFPRYGVQFLNSPYIKLAYQTSPEALQFKQVVADLRGHIAAVLAKGYAPQKEQIDEAMKYIPDTITPKQLKEDIPFLNRLIDIQVKGMMTPASAVSKEKEKEKEAPTGKYEDVINKVMGGR